MSQYTDKINKIAEDFAEIEYYETLSALEGRNGMLIQHFQHGGKKITFSRYSEYEDTVGKAGDVIVLPPTDKDYLMLKERYTSETWGHKIGKWWKKFRNIKYSRGFWND